jgi:hypothetical protein
MLLRSNINAQQTGFNDRFVDHKRWSKVAQQSVVKIISMIAMILVTLCRAT